MLWNAHRQLRCNVIVKTGGKLTINCDVGFPSNASIKVERQGHLTVQGARLYNNCDGDHWQGIVAYGDINAPQLPSSNQTRVRLKDGSTIELAEKPLTVSAPTLVLADNTVFDRCGTSTFTNLYNLQFSSLSRFTNCDFLNNSATPFLFTENFKLTNIRGITFDNCTFATTPGLSNVSGPIAINAHNARFGVHNGSDFTNYRRAIVASADNGVDRSFRVTNSYFNNNFMSIENWNVDGCSIRDNIIEGIGSSIWPPNRPSVGITLRNCTRYEVTGNSLTGTSNTGNNIGIWAYDTGSDGNNLRRNNFTNMKTADYATLNNKGEQPFQGLQYWCNTNTNCWNDFFVIAGGICQEQGLGKATGNEFSKVNTANGDFLNQGGSPINYYHLDLPNQTPQYYSNISPSLVLEFNDCTGSGGGEEESDGELSSQDEQVLITKFNNAKSEYQTKRVQYDALQSGSPAALVLIPDLAKQRSIMHRSADRILRSEFYDPENLDWTKIRTWLHNKDSKESEYAIVESWMLEGNTATAEQVFDAIPSTFNLTGDALAQHNDYEDWLNLRISFKSQQKGIYELGAADVLLVQNIADNSTGRAAAQTQGLLNHQYDYNYQISPVGLGSLPLLGPNGNGTMANAENLIAFPNPGKEEVNFRYKLREGIEESLLSIHNLEGHLVASIALQGSFGTVRWETKSLPSGIYYYKADNIEGFVAPQKLVLIK